MREFLAMGGYGGYVWPCFGITAAVIVANLLAARRRLESTRARLATRLRRQETAGEET